MLVCIQRSVRRYHGVPAPAGGADSTLGAPSTRAPAKPAPARAAVPRKRRRVVVTPRAPGRPRRAGQARREARVVEIAVAPETRDRLLDLVIRKSVTPQAAADLLLGMVAAGEPGQGAAVGRGRTGWALAHAARDCSGAPAARRPAVLAWNCGCLATPTPNAR